MERKYRLRTAPSAALLSAHDATALRIEQVYLRLVPGTDARRIRRTTRDDGSVELVGTEKASLGPGTLARREREWPLDATGYDALLAEADPTLRPVRKTRHVVAHGEQQLEIDVFEEPPGLVVVEVELEDDDEPVALPAWLGEWVEVTEDRRYLNAVLAHPAAEIPPWPEDRTPRARVSSAR